MSEQSIKKGDHVVCLAASLLANEYASEVGGVYMVLDASRFSLDLSRRGKTSIGCAVTRFRLATAADTWGDLSVGSPPPVTQPAPPVTRATMLEAVNRAKKSLAGDLRMPVDSIKISVALGLSA